MTTQAEYVREVRHLPPPLRDFHDQKDAFKSLHEWIGKPAQFMSGPEISWVDGQCYVIDYFLAFMAAHGWTLQRSRAQVEFADLDATIAKRREREAASFRDFLAAADAERA